MRCGSLVIFLDTETKVDIFTFSKPDSVIRMTAFKEGALNALKVLG